MKGPRWGRTGKGKQKELPLEAKDCCSGLKWSRYPAWTEAMQEVLGRDRDPKHKWYSLRLPTLPLLLGLIRPPAVESRVWENLLHGSEGGAAYARPYP